MFAIFKSGARQYKVKAGDVLKVDQIAGDQGSTVVFDNVLAAGGADGVKLTPSTKVSAEIVNQTKDEKVVIFKKKRRHNYRRKRGHRQAITWIKIQEIGENLKAKAAPAQSEKAGVEKKAAPKAAAPKAEAKTESRAAAPKKAVSEKAPAAKKPAASKE